MKKRFFAALASLCVMVSALPMVAFAEGESGTPLVPSTLVQNTQAGSALCEHHPSHDEACGYTEGTEGSLCAHEHDEDCYQLVTECVHEHSPECYPAESVSENTATPSQPEEADPTVCTHVCGEDTGCVIKTLNCQHQHDESCGYVPAAEGTPCSFVCEVCNAQDSGNPGAPSDAQPEECTCETLCTGDNINADCPVCGAEGAEPTACGGLEAQPATLSNALPVTALAADGGTVYVGGVTLSGSTDSPAYATTDDNGTVTIVDASADKYNIKWDGSTLTLDGAKIKGGTSSESLHATVGIYAFSNSGDVSLNIALKGVNEIFESSNGIWVYSSSDNAGAVTLTIEGEGSLNASGSSSGILVQSNSGDATLAIQNAEVTATSTNVDGVQVRSGAQKSASLTVDGGSLTATGMSEYGAGIRYTFGSSSSGSGTPSLTVSGNAMVKASGGEGGIRDNSSTNPKIGEDSSGTSGGIVFDGNEGTVYGSVTLQENLTIGEGESLTIPDGASLTIGDGATLTVDGGELTGENIPTEGVVYKVTEVKLDKDSLSLEVGGTETLTATITPDNATNKNVTWESSNTSVATVDADGKVTAVSAGTATITVTTADGGFTDTCTVTVNPVQYTVTVQTDGNGTASASPATAPAGTTITLTADPDSGYHFERWEVVSDSVTISGNQFTMPAENVTVKAVFDRNSSGGGSSGGSSYRDREYDFWMDVRDEIRHADPGDTVKANARTYDRMPWSVMEALRKTDGVTLHITWNGGEDIVIPSEAALSEQSRIYYPLSYLEDIDFTVDSKVEPEAPATGPSKVNPVTGGIWEVTAPAAADAITTPAGEPEVTDSRRGLAETPELADEGIEQPLPGIYESEETVSTSTTEETGTSGLLITGVVAVFAAAAGGVFWFWKRRKQA